MEQNHGRDHWRRHLNMRTDILSGLSWQSVPITPRSWRNTLPLQLPATAVDLAPFLLLLGSLGRLARTVPQHVCPHTRSSSPTISPTIFSTSLLSWYFFLSLSTVQTFAFTFFPALCRVPLNFLTNTCADTFTTGNNSICLNSMTKVI